MKISKENKAGLYITVIFHLVVIIVLLICRIDSTIKSESSFVLDFSKQEEIEKRQQEEIFREDIAKKLDRLLGEAANVPPSKIKNIVVDNGSRLKDDRNTDAEQLYKDAERLAADLKNGGKDIYKDAVEEDARDETVDLSSITKKDDKGSKEYTGASVVSYSLDGRKARHLKIPAYRCYSAGDVTVLITVSKDGRVVAAEVHEGVSSDDPCLRREAIRSARLSFFRASATAPEKQNGEIVYRFLAQ